MRRFEHANQTGSIDAHQASVAGDPINLAVPTDHEALDLRRCKFTFEFAYRAVGGDLDGGPAVRSEVGGTRRELGWGGNLDTSIESRSRLLLGLLCGLFGRRDYGLWRLLARPVWMCGVRARDNRGRKQQGQDALEISGRSAMHTRSIEPWPPERKLTLRA